MQMNALRSENFAKLSSSNATSDAYWLTSMSDGTPGGYCLSQIRSMGLSLESGICLVLHPERGPGRFFFPGSMAMRWNMASGCALSTHRTRRQTGLTSQNPCKSREGCAGQLAGLASGLGFAAAGFAGL